MNQNKKAQHEMASWASVIMRYLKKCMVCKPLQRFVRGVRGTSFWLGENYSGWVDFESHSPRC